MKKTLLTCCLLATGLHMVMAQPKQVISKQLFTNESSTCEYDMTPTSVNNENKRRDDGIAVFRDLKHDMDVQIANTNAYIYSLKATYRADSAKAAAGNEAVNKEKTKALADQQNAAALLRSGPDNQQYKAGVQTAQAAVNTTNANANKVAAELQALQKEAALIKYYSGILQTQKNSVAGASMAMQAMPAPGSPDVIQHVHNLTNDLNVFAATLQ